MAISAVTSTAQVAGGTGSNVTITVPTGTTAGDVLVCIIAERTNSATDKVTAISNGGAAFTSQNYHGNGSNAGVAMWTRVVQAGDPSTYTIATTVDIEAALMAYRGVDNSTPIDASGTANGNSGTAITMNAVTTGVNNAWFVGGVAQVETGATSSSDTATKRTFSDNGGNNSTKIGVYMADKLVVTAGSSGAQTFTSSVSGAWESFAVSLKPNTNTTTNQTQQGLARITATTNQTQTGKARVTATTTQTQLGKARITATTLQTQTGKSRIQKVVNQTQQGLARITATTLQTILGKGDIRKSTTQTQTGLSRIQQIVNKTQQGVTRITASALQTITGKARIQNSTTQTITGLARIQQSVNQTIQGLAKIAVSNVTTTQTTQGLARIQQVVNKTMQGLSRITASTVQTIPGLARITASTTQTIQGLARITAVSIQTIQGKSRITKVSNQTIQGQANLVSLSVQTVAGKANILGTTTRTITGKARILSTVSKPEPQLIFVDGELAMRLAGNQYIRL